MAFRKLLVVVVLALVSSSASLVQAQASTDDEARSLFEAGRTAFASGRFQAALDYFEQSFELSHRPELLFNIGSAADRLQQNARALEAYRAYVEAVPNAGNRGLAEARITFFEERARENPEATPTETTEGGEGDVEVSSTATDPAAQTDTSGGGDVTGEWWFWTLIAVLVIGAGVGITLGVVLSAGPNIEPPLPGDVPATMALVGVSF